MESLGFVLMYFLRGSLPWQGLRATTKKQKYQRILECKQATHPDQLCRGYPNEFRDYFVHCSMLGFEDRPDYRYLKRIFRDLFERQCFEDDGVFDWDIIKKNQQIPPEVSGGGDAAAEAVRADGGRDPAGAGDSAAMNPSGRSGFAQNTSQRETPAGRDGDDANDGNDKAEANPKRSLISSIR